jgi:hypothetical protein
MTEPQQAICRELLELCYRHGFDCYYSLAPIAEKLGITDVLYDNNTNTGILWSLGKFGDGFLSILTDGRAATVPWILRDELARRCNYRGF